MQLIIFNFLLLATATLTIALDLQHEDLNDPTKPCGVKKASCDRQTSPDLSRNFTIRSCMCDSVCATYGDCCINSPHFKDADQRRAVTQFNCMYYEDLGSYYVKQSCPASWIHTDIRRKCEKSVNNILEDPLLMTPVTDRRDNVTYGNIFCAICNGHTLGAHYLDLWQIGFKCPNHSPLALHKDDAILDRVTFDEKQSFWQLIDHNQSIPCSFHRVIPEHSKPRLAPCPPNMIKTCPATWIHEQQQPQPQQPQPQPRNASGHSSSTGLLSRETIRTACESYTMVVYPTPTASEYQVSYRNIHCAMCNSVKVQDLSCENTNWGRFGHSVYTTDVPSLTILFDFSSLMQNKNKSCGPGRVYDGLLKTCRDDIDVQRAAPFAGTPTDCPSTMSIETNFSFVDDNVYIPHHNRTYEMGQYVYHQQNQSVTVCNSGGGGSGSSGGGGGGSASDHQRLQASTYPIHFRIISVVGIGVSIICLVAHLVAFALLKELRNLSGKNLASLCWALLAAYASFVLANSLASTACLVNAALTYYFFLAAFSWMLIMSFDVWRSLKIATKELRVSSGKQWRKFFIYSACGWLVPAKFVLVALLVDLCPMGESGQRFQPKFGQDACWFNNGQALLLFFILPVSVTLVCNVGFFIFSAVMIYSSHSMTRYSASPATKRDFRLYARLSLIMGLTWITGLVASVANSNAVWILFIMSNAFLGLFIFLAFTWRKAVLHGLKNLKRDSVLNLPAFSWSMNSTSSVESKSQVRSDERRTSNTYY